MDYSDSNELVDVEVVRLQSNYAKEDADELESVKCLCKAFSFGLKIIDQYENGQNPCRQYEIYYSPGSFFSEGLRTAIKTFILTSGLTYVHDKNIRMKLYDYIDMPSDGIYAEENLLVYRPSAKK